MKFSRGKISLLHNRSRHAYPPDTLYSELAAIRMLDAERATFAKEREAHQHARAAFETATQIFDAEARSVQDLRAQLENLIAAMGGNKRAEEALRTLQADLDYKKKLTAKVVGAVHDLTKHQHEKSEHKEHDEFEHPDHHNDSNQQLRENILQIIDSAEEASSRIDRAAKELPRLKAACAVLGAVKAYCEARFSVMSKSPAEEQVQGEGDTTLEALRDTHDLATNSLRPEPVIMAGPPIDEEEHT